MGEKEIEDERGRLSNVYIALKSLSATSEVSIVNLKMLTTKGQSNLPKQRTLGPTWMALASQDLLQSQPRTQWDGPRKLCTEALGSLPSKPRTGWPLKV